MKRMLYILVVAGLAALFAFSKERTRELGVNSYRLLSLPPLVQLHPKLIDAITLGHRGLYDDFISIWLLQILMSDDLPTVTADELNDVSLAILKQRPKLESIYMLTCFILARDYGRSELCHQIIHLGLELFPNSWRLPVTLGFMYAFQLNDKERASAYYHMAASRPDAPKYFATAAQKMAAGETADSSDLETSLDLIFSADPDSRIKSFFDRPSAPLPQPQPQPAAPEAPPIEAVPEPTQEQ